MIFLNFVILCMIRDIRLRKSPSLLEQFSHRLHEIEIYYPSMMNIFSQKKKICSSGMEFLLIQRMVENQPYRRFRLRLHRFMSRRVCHKRALLYLNLDITALYYSKKKQHMQYDNKCCLCRQNGPNNTTYDKYDNQSWLKQVKTMGRQFGVHILQEYSHKLHQPEELYHQKLVQNRDSMLSCQSPDVDWKVLVD